MAACKACRSERQQEYVRENAERCRQYSRRYAAHPNRKAHQQAYFRKLRARVLEGYGGRCVCCGETTPEFLAIDHINSDGNKHRRELKSVGTTLYLWIIKNNFPKDYLQLLCHNCNMAKGCYGVCPHVKQRETAA